MSLSDEQIQKNVLEEFKWDARVKPNEIGVTVKNGVVTLSGTVDSYPKKWRAEKIALRVSGVKAVANEIQVKLPTSSDRTDEDIAADAKLILESSVDIPDTITVSVDKGWITLHGVVEWQHQKEAAEHKVRDVRGIKGVINLIEVAPATEPQDVKRRIEQALIRAAEIDAKNIDVEVRDGTVVLKGHVHSWHEKEEARREAWLAPGVREVVDELVVSL